LNKEDVVDEINF